MAEMCFVIGSTYLGVASSLGYLFAFYYCVAESVTLRRSSPYSFYMQSTISRNLNRLNS